MSRFTKKAFQPLDQEEKDLMESIKKERNVPRCIRVEAATPRPLFDENRVHITS